MRRVLIVEDDNKTMALLKEAFQTEGFEVLTAEDGMEAIKVLDTELVDVIASDVNLPRLDGYQLAHRVKSDARTKKLPFVLYSSREATSEDIELAMRNSVDKYVEKTGTKAVVDEVINQVSKAIR